VPHAGVALVRALADSSRLTGGLERALLSDRLLVNHRDRVLVCIADGGEAVNDCGVMGDRGELFGPTAASSAPPPQPAENPGHFPGAADMSPASAG
jgi:hypothetical protein